MLIHGWVGGGGCHKQQRTRHATAATGSAVSGLLASSVLPAELVAFQFSQLKPRDQAMALTMAGLRMFRKIEPDEFAIHMWGSKEQRASGELMRNLNAFVERFNRVGYWVATDVCSKTDIKARTIAIELYIRVAKVSTVPAAWSARGQGGTERAHR